MNIDFSRSYVDEQMVITEQPLIDRLTSLNEQARDARDDRQDACSKLRISTVSWITFGIVASGILLLTAKVTVPLLISILALNILTGTPVLYFAFQNMKFKNLEERLLTEWLNEEGTIDKAIDHLREENSRVRQLTGIAMLDYRDELEKQRSDLLLELTTIRAMNQIIANQRRRALPNHVLRAALNAASVSGIFMGLRI